MCVQETKWKGCKAKEIGNVFKLFYNGSNGKRNGVAPQTDCDEEKTQFWEDLEEDLREIPESERLWIGGDFNGHCGSNNRGKEDAIRIYGVGASNVAGDQLVDFTMSHSLRIVNTFFKKAERHRITYKSRDAVTD
ncbi:craniofacial development protein 2-like [Penaeus vannamei]|uniref:craniofacial development protein 2-like n=1 Tax=Penaeus vannamei TaxID=6689 RepID=UPI00387F9425